MIVGSSARLNGMVMVPAESVTVILVSKGNVEGKNSICGGKSGAKFEFSSVDFVKPKPLFSTVENSNFAPYLKN